MSQQINEHLAAENAALREAIEFAIAPDMWIERDNNIFEYRYLEWYVDVLNAALGTPDAAVTDIQQQIPSGWVKCSDRLPVERERPYQVMVASVKTMGGLYEGKPVRRFIQDWAVRCWPQNFIAWQEDNIGFPCVAEGEQS